MSHGWGAEDTELFKDQLMTNLAGWLAGGTGMVNIVDLARGY
jgi:hypothetical protein